MQKQILKYQHIHIYSQKCHAGWHKRENWSDLNCWVRHLHCLHLMISSNQSTTRQSNKNLHSSRSPLKIWMKADGGFYKMPVHAWEHYLLYLSLIFFMTFKSYHPDVLLPFLRPEEENFGLYLNRPLPIIHVKFIREVVQIFKPSQLKPNFNIWLTLPMPLSQ